MFFLLKLLCRYSRFKLPKTRTGDLQMVFNQLVRDHEY